MIRASRFGDLLRSGVRGAWASATIASWAGLVARLGSFAVVMPLALVRLSVEEVALWLLLGSVATLQVIGDAGFGLTFSRAIAHALGGARIEDLGRLSNRRSDRKTAVNEEALLGILAAQYPIYKKLTFASFVLLSVIGTYAVSVPIGRVPHVVEAWVAWSAIVATTTISIWGNIYLSYLTGTDRIAILKRWETLFSLLGILTSVLALLLYKSVMALILAQQFWQVLTVLRNHRLCIRDERFRLARGTASDSRVLTALWPSAWRSAVGLIMSLGIIQASGFFVARVSSGANFASYMLGLRIVQAISQFAQAPFYSKLSRLARLHAEGDHKQEIDLAYRGIRLATFTFLAGFLFAGIVAPNLLVFIGSKAVFPSKELWTFLGLAFFLERVGAMHLQLYSITNHIVWHIVNGLTGLMMFAAAYFLYPKYSLVALPFGMTLAYFAVYVPISVFLSYKEYSLRFFDSDFKSVVVPFFVAMFVWAATWIF